MNSNLLAEHSRRVDTLIDHCGKLAQTAAPSNSLESTADQLLRLTLAVTQLTSQLTLQAEQMVAAEAKYTHLLQVKDSLAAQIRVSPPNTQDSMMSSPAVLSRQTPASASMPSEEADRNELEDKTRTRGRSRSREREARGTAAEAARLAAEGGY